MQLGILNLLLGNQATPAAQGSGDGESSQGANVFSQLLGDPGAQGSHGGNASLTGEIKSSALLAQDLNLEQLIELHAGDRDVLARLLSTEIGPEEASALLEKLSAMGWSGKGDQAWGQLKETLEQIEASGEPREVADILESLPEGDALDDGHEHSPVLQRMMQWLHAALDKRKEAPTPADVDAEVTAAAVASSPTALSLQASIFRAGDAEDEAAAPDQSAPAEKTREVTLIVPLSQPMVALPEWVKKLGSPDAALDEAIPSLTLQGDDALPNVDLPEVNLAGMKAVEPKAAPEFLEQLKPLVAHGEHAAQVPVTHVSELSADGVHALQGPGSTHSAHANYNSTGSAQVTPHLGASEQVHVAITRAKDDGLDRITLQLEPAELGRVEVKMDLMADGRTRIAFMVDRAETLEQLARDARALERALQEAGIKSDAGHMQFNLRQQPEFANDGMGQPQHGQPQAQDDEHASLDKREQVADVAITRSMSIAINNGVDIRA